jgi:catechol 2,3-dioxygenase-like lactoylglutathione lyase family enzyme
MTQGADTRPLQVKFSFHPTFNVPTLEEAESFFQRVFNQPSALMVTVRDKARLKPGEPAGYSKFVMIRDLLLDYVCPALHTSQNGRQFFPDVDAPVLMNVGWYTDDITQTFRALRAAGIPLVSQAGEPAEGDEPPNVSQSPSAMKMFFTPADRVGLRYQFIPVFPMEHDPRLTPGWALPPVSKDDPLQIKHLSHHTILTEDPQRAVRFMQAIGGTVLFEGRDEQRAVSGPYVHLADAIYHYATPDAGTEAAAALATRTPADKYYAFTFNVTDLDRVAAHLDHAGVKIQSRTADTIVTDPATSLQTPWGFTTARVPGDTRD